MRKSIIIEQETHRRLELKKGRVSYAAYIDCMLNYFELNGIDPLKELCTPGQQIVERVRDSEKSIYKRIDDLIKIVRSIERDKIDLIVERTASSGDTSDSDAARMQMELNQMYESHRKVMAENTELKEIVKKQNNVLKTIPFAAEEALSEKYYQTDNSGNIVLSKENINDFIKGIKKIIDVQ